MRISLSKEGKRKSFKWFKETFYQSFKAFSEPKRTKKLEEAYFELTGKKPIQKKRKKKED
jgi:hypothetical protein